MKIGFVILQIKTWGLIIMLLALLAGLFAGFYYLLLYIFKKIRENREQ